MKLLAASERVGTCDEWKRAYRKQISILTRQINLGRVQEFMNSYITGKTSALEQHVKKILSLFTQFKHNVQHEKANARNYGSTITTFWEKSKLYSLSPER